jgi:hypothetical protein
MAQSRVVTGGALGECVHVAGVMNFLRPAEMYVNTIDVAWAVEPLFWFNAKDGRGPHDLETWIWMHQELMAWYGARCIRVEFNEPHH